MNTFSWRFYVFIGLVASFLAYSVLLYCREYEEPLPANELAQEGKMIWQQKNCVSCHQFYGLGGHLGPDLTNVYSKRNEPYIKAFLKTGTQIMPDFQLSEHEMDALVAFLKYTDATGISDPRSFTRNIYGTISKE